MNNYAYKQDYDNYVENLRGYYSNASTNMRDIQLRSTKQPAQSPKRDHFVEGQISIRSPKVRNGLAVLKSYQTGQCNRLSVPRKSRDALMDWNAEIMNSRHSLMNSIEKPESASHFLRKSG